MRLLRKPRFLAIGLGSMLTVAGMISLRYAAADLVAPKPGDGRVAFAVAELLKEDHLLKRPLDDEISHRALDTVLKQLDPMKLYFYQSDIDEFQQNRDKIDDWIKKGDIKFAYSIYNRFLQRVDERVAMVEELLKSSFDFSADEDMISDPEAAHYATSREEALDRWRRRLKYDFLVLKTEKVEKKAAQPGAEDASDKPSDGSAPNNEGANASETEHPASTEDPVDRLRRRYTSYAKRMHQFSSDDLLELYLTAITSAFDPHTNYMSPSSLENFNIQMKLNLEGIGAALMMSDGYTVVSKIIPGGAADKHHKLQPEDRIVSVGQGDSGEMVDVVDMNLNDVVKLIRGKAGTVVRLGVKPAGSNDVQVYSITRATIELKDSEARGEIIPYGQKPDGSQYQVGVIDLPSFYMDMAGARRGLSDYKSTTRDMRRILENFNENKVDVVILDLSRNGGGSLTEAINLTGLFVDEGPVVQVKDADGRVQHYDDLEHGMVWKGPLVVLTSKFSASASEIFAGAIQDYSRGIIVGDYSTHGKGTVQSLLDLGTQLFDIPNPPNLGALKITMQQFYRPNGESTQKRGVLADVALPSIRTQMDVGESDLDYPVEFDRVDPARYQTNRMVDKNTLAELASRSGTRRTGSADFAKLDRQIEQYKQQKAKKSVTLNEQKFFAERAEFDADKEDEEKIKEQVDSERPVFRRDFYNDEVLNITVDYIELLLGNKVAAGGPLKPAQ